MAFVPSMRLARITLMAAALGQGALCLAVFAPAPARAETPVHFTLDRKLDGAAAPFYLAIDKGYYKAEGLDVTIDEATAPLEPIRRLAAGGYDMGAGDINVLIRYRDANPGTAVKALFAVFDKPAYAIVARRSRGIAAPKDLEGKRLGAPSAEGTFAQWPIFAQVNGIDLAKVTVETIGLPVREPMLAAGELDAVTAYSFTSYVDLKEAGVPPDDLVVLLMADYGLKLYGNAIMASQHFAAAKPDAVRGFLRAYVRALKDTVRDPSRAVDSVVRRMASARKDVELERLTMAIRDNILTPAVQANGFGCIDPTRLAAAIDQLALAYTFRAKDQAAEVFDPSFLPEAAER